MADVLAAIRRYFLAIETQLSLPIFVTLMSGMVAVSDLGLLSAADGVLYAILLSILLPTLTPYLLVAICTFQDVAGLSMFWWYGGTVLLGGLVTARCLARGRLQDAIPQELFMLLAFALLIIVYAGLTSLLQTHLQGHPQSEGRPPLLVACLMMGMMIAGVAAFLELSKDGYSNVRLKWLTVILITNGLFVALVKAKFGLEMFASHGGLIYVQAASQLTEDSALGIPRLIGTFLTPNGFALCYGLVMLLLLARQGRVDERFILGYAVVGGMLGALSLSKAMAAFFLLTSIILVFQSKYAKPVFVMGLIALIFFATFIWGTQAGESVLAAFRITFGGESDLGYRSQAWQLITQSLDVSDWLFGTGLAYWEILFEQNLGFSLSDPHTYVLSIPGTYGLLGVVFYIFVGASLASTAWQKAGAQRALALILLVLIFVKDLVSIPYLIGNTPLTLLIWMLMAGVFIGSEGFRICGKLKA